MPFKWLISPKDLLELQQQQDLVLIDVRSQEEFQQGHIPDARRLEYASLLRVEPPAGGLLPAEDTFNTLMGNLGIATHSQVVVYDVGQGAAASRLIWSLNAFGFKNASLLNGGIKAWVDDNQPLSTHAATYSRTQPLFTLDGTTVVDVRKLMSRLDDPTFAKLDARTRAEYIGADVRSKYGGRIPGAAHLEWTDAIDESQSFKLLPDDQLQVMLDARGITKDKDVLVYCQTHHRSSLSYLMLKHLGYSNVMALDGAWSNWGNRDDTPRDTG